MNTQNLYGKLHDILLTLTDSCQLVLRANRPGAAMPKESLAQLQVQLQASVHTLQGILYPAEDLEKRDPDPTGVLDLDAMGVNLAHLDSHPLRQAGPSVTPGSPASMGQVWDAAAHKGRGAWRSPGTKPGTETGGSE